MTSRVLFAAVIMIFAAAHVVALQKMHATAHADPMLSGAIEVSGD